jgi:hypothetical protein
MKISKASIIEACNHSSALICTDCINANNAIFKKNKEFATLEADFAEYKLQAQTTNEQLHLKHEQLLMDAVVLMEYTSKWVPEKVKQAAERIRKASE